MKGKTVFITGMAGYVGECLCRELEKSPWCSRFWGIDVKTPLYKYKKGQFKRMDINDPALGKWIEETAPDVVVHLAFVLAQIHDPGLMYKINVDGTKSVLAAVESANVSQLMVTSSATAYGAFPDNPVPLKETDPIRQHPAFQYAKDKAEVEWILDAFAAAHPEKAVCWVRPCVIYGPNVNNYISGLFTLPVAMAPKGDFVPTFQFVHEDDVAAAMLFLIQKQAKGPFNLAPPDTITIDEINAVSGKMAFPLPEKVLRGLFRITWDLRLPLLKVPPSFSDYVFYPWLVDPAKLLNLGFSFNYSTRETLEIMLRAKGQIK
ncbi:MAG: NAD-dependent epimerase/dehydratase family protein [Desulfatibacillaceae bacterium]|nr:NAD-dependent epimerase/dehydratase family protein [Desulfatibacillaceae bacterium]